MEELKRCAHCGGKAECFKDKLGEWCQQGDLVVDSLGCQIVSEKDGSCFNVHPETVELVIKDNQTNNQ